MSNSLQHHGLQYTRLSYPSPYPRVCPSSCPLNWWCHPTISSSVTLFFCLQSFPASGSFPMSWLFASGTHLLQALVGYFLRKVILSSRNVAQIIYLRVSKMEVNHDFWCWESVKSGDPKIKKNPLPLCIPLRWQVFSGSNCVLRKQSPEMRSGSHGSYEPQEQPAELKTRQDQITRTAAPEWTLWEGSKNHRNESQVACCPPRTGFHIPGSTLESPGETLSILMPRWHPRKI